MEVQTKRGIQYNWQESFGEQQIMEVTMRYKKLYSFAAILVVFGMVSLYFYNSVPAKQNRKEITLGTSSGQRILDLRR